LFDFSGMFGRIRAKFLSKPKHLPAATPMLSKHYRKKTARGEDLTVAESLRAHLREFIYSSARKIRCDTE